MSRKTRIIVATVVLVLIAAAAAYALFGRGGAGPRIETAQVAERPLAITVTASGAVEKGLSSDVFAPTTGTLLEVKVSEGATVSAGQTLAVMDPAPLELQVAQARAGLSQAEAQLAAIDDQAPSASDIEAARAQVAAAEEAYSAAKVQLASVGNQAPSSAQLAAAAAATAAAKTAYEQAQLAYEAAVAASPQPSMDASVAIAAATRDQAYAGYLGAAAQERSLTTVDLSAARAQAQAGVDQAYAALQGANAQLKTVSSADTAAGRRAAEAAIEQAAHALALAEKNLENSVLKAPIDGTVIVDASGGGSAAAAAAAAGAGALGASSGGSWPKAGAAVSPGAPVFTIVDLNALKFAAEVDEADIGRIRVGMPSEVSLDAFPDHVFKTVVSHVDPVAKTTATGGTVFVVELALTDTGQDVLLGMKGDVEIEVNSVGSVVTIPIEALFSEGGTDYVYLVEEGKLERRDITVGATTDTEVEVLEGLTEGDRVALSGSVQYSDGMAVQVDGD